MKRITDFKCREVYLKETIDKNEDPKIPRLAILLNDIESFYILRVPEIKNWLMDKRGNKHKWSMEQINSINAFVKYFFGMKESDFFTELDVIAQNCSRKKKKKPSNKKTMIGRKDVR